MTPPSFSLRLLRVSDDARPALIPLVATLLLVALLAVFASDYLVLRILAARLSLPLLLAGATIFAAFGTGRMLTRFVAARAYPGTPPPRADAASDFLLGYPLFGLFAFLVATLSAGAVAQTLVLIAGIVLGALALRDLERQSDGDPCSDAARAIGWIGAALFLALGFLHAQAPAFTLDELAYHLAIPRQWAIAGSAIELPLLSHSYFPLGIESADLPAIAILGADGAIATHFVHLFAAAATALLLFRWLGTTAVGAAAWLAIVSTPALLLTAGWAWNEWPLLGIVIVAVRSAMQFAAGRAEESARLSMALAAGMLVKYTFAPAALVIVGATFLAVRRDRVRTAFLVRGLIIAAIAGSAFLLRNLILTGNPLAPFFQDGAPAVSQFRWEGSLLATARGYLFHGQFLDEALGVALPSLAVAGLLVIATGTLHARLLCGGFFVSAALLVSLAPSSRILIPFLAIPAAFAAASLSGAASRSWRGIAALLLILAAGAQLHLAFFHTLRSGVAPLTAGVVSGEEFLAANRRGFLAIQAIDRALPLRSRTLVLGTNEIFWFSREVVGGGNADGPRISRWLASGDLAAKLQRERVTHVAIVPAGLFVSEGPSDRRALERSTVLEPAAAEALQRFLATNGRELTSSDDFALYEIAR